MASDLIISCPSCNQRIRIPEQKSRTLARVHCPGCGSPIDLKPMAQSAPPAPTPPPPAATPPQPAAVPAPAVAPAPVAAATGRPAWFFPVICASIAIAACSLTAGVFVLAFGGQGTDNSRQLAQNEPDEEEAESPRPSKSRTGSRTTARNEEDEEPVEEPPESEPPEERSGPRRPLPPFSKAARDKLKTEVSDLEKKKGQLQKDKADLERQIERLINYKTQFTPWKDATLVVRSENNQLVGLKPGTGGRLHLIAKASGQDARIATVVARRAGGMFVPDSGSFVPQTFRLQVGDEVSLNGFDQLKRVQKADRLPVRVPTSHIEFVSYVHAQTGQRRMAMISEPAATGNSIPCWTIDEPKFQLSPKDVEPGTARRGTLEEMQFYVTDDEYIEMCLDAMLCHLIDDCHRSFPDYLDSGYLPLEGLGLAISVDGSSAQLPDLETVFGWLRPIFGSKQPDARVAQLAKQLENRLYNRLSKIDGLIVRDQQHLMTLMQFIPTSEAARDFLIETEKSLQNRGRPESLAGYLSDVAARASRDQVARFLNVDAAKALFPVSHVLAVDINPPASGGVYQLSMRLLKRDSQVLWSTTSDRTAGHSLEGTRHLNVGGSLTKIELKGAKLPPQLLDDGNVLPGDTLKKFGAAGTDRATLIMLESRTNRSALCRPLFGSKTFEVPLSSDDILTPAGSGVLVPQRDRIRQMLWTLLDKILPKTGHLVELQDGTGEGIITLGRQHGFSERAEFAVVRPGRAGLQAGVLSSATARIVAADDAFSRVKVIDADLFPGNHTGLAGSRVISPQVVRPIIHLQQLTAQPPPYDRQLKMNLPKEPGKARRIMQLTQQMAERLTLIAQHGLQAYGAQTTEQSGLGTPRCQPVYSYLWQHPTPAAGRTVPWTHAVSGVIAAHSEGVYLVHWKITLSGTNQEVGNFTSELTLDAL